MLTLFTTAKKFYGKNRINQLNAIRSWLQAPYPVEIIIFDKVEGDDIDELKDNSKIKIIEEIATNPNGVPELNFMFDTASKLAFYEIICYVNADIILPKSFFEDIVYLHRSINKDYLLVGQRIDVDVEESIDFDNEWEERFWEQHPDHKVHMPTGSDFFVFPKGQYSIENMPNLLVGRPGWDLWMIYDGLKNRRKVIDLSLSTKVIHQNHDYLHKVNVEQLRKKDDEHNYQFLPENLKYKFTLIACNYYYSKNKVTKNYARGDLNLYMNYCRWLKGNSFTAKLKCKMHFYQLRFFEKLKIVSYIPK